MESPLKTYNDYENDPYSRMQTTEYMLGSAVAPLPSSPHDAIRQSLINGHTLFRGESGVVMEASEVLDKEDMLDVEVPEESDYLEDSPVRVRIHDFKIQHKALKQHGHAQGSSDALLAIGANSIPPVASDGDQPNLTIQIPKNGVKSDIEIAYNADPADTLNLIRNRMDVLPDVMIGYKLPGEGVRRAPHSLLSSNELQVAIETLKGMIRRSRGAKKILQITTVESESVGHSPTQPSTATGRITTRLASRKEILDGLDSVPEAARSIFAELWTKLGCVVPGHNKCVIDNESHPPVHKPVSIKDASYWANQITQGRATLTIPPNDIRWDHQKSVPHVSSASAGSSATKVLPLFTVRKGTSVISIPSDSSTATLLLEQRDVKPSLKREHSFSPDLSTSAGHARSKRRLDEPTRPHLVVCEGVHYPTVTDVLVALNKVFPLHSYLTYDDMMSQHQIYYAPDVTTMSVDWYVENMGMGRSSAVHLCDYAALMTARVCHETNY